MQRKLEMVFRYEHTYFVNNKRLLHTFKLDLDSCAKNFSLKSQISAAFLRVFVTNLYRIASGFPEFRFFGWISSVKNMSQG